MRSLLWVLAMLLAPLAGALLYVLVACALMVWPAHRTPPDAPIEVQAWVLSNGVHTDLVFPLRDHGVDWRTLFPPQHLRAPPADAEFIGIGWGDREFYLHTPTWADLTAKRALGAALGRNSALLHVSYLRRADLAASAYRLPLTAAQYQTLRAYVQAALPDGQAQPVPGAHYGRHDAFYEATGRYNLFETCNAWTGRGLRQAGIPVSPWTPFDFNVVWRLESGRP